MINNVEQKAPASFSKDTTYEFTFCDTDNVEIKFTLTKPLIHTLQSETNEYLKQQKDPHSSTKYNFIYWNNGFSDEFNCTNIFDLPREHPDKINAFQKTREAFP